MDGKALLSGVDLLDMPGDRLLNIVWSMLVDDADAWVNRAEVRDKLDELIHDIPLSDADEDEWGMEVEDEEAMQAWAAGLPSPTAPDMQH